MNVAELYTGRNTPKETNCGAGETVLAVSSKYEGQTGIPRTHGKPKCGSLCFRGVAEAGGLCGVLASQSKLSL